MRRILSQTFPVLLCFLSAIVLVSCTGSRTFQPYIPPHPSSFRGEPVPLFTVQLNGKEGCINADGSVTIEPRFEEIRCSADPLIPFRTESKWGFVDQSGEVILEPQFASTAMVGYGPTFSEGLSAVCMNAKCGYIDFSGNYAIEPKFDYAENFSDGFALVQFGAKDFLGYRYRSATTMFIDKRGANAFPNSAFVPESNFRNGWAAISLHSRRGCLDKSGSMSMPIERITSCEFSDGLAVAEESPMGAFGYVDIDGKSIIPFEFRQAGEFSDGLAVVMFQSGKYGYIDKTGQTMIPPKYDVADTFYEGRAVVSVGYKNGYIDEHGNEITPTQFGSAERFVNGLARVSFDDQNPPYDNKRYGYINRFGTFVWPPSK